MWSDYSLQPKVTQPSWLSNKLPTQAIQTREAYWSSQLCTLQSHSLNKRCYSSELRGCLPGGGPALFVRLALSGLACTWEKPALLSGLARLAKSPGLTMFIFSRNPIFYILHIYKQSLWNEKLPKKFWSRQPLSRVRSFDLLGGPALLSAFIWEICSLPRRDLGSQ